MAGNSRQFTVSGVGLTADIDLTPPAGYEISTQCRFRSLSRWRYTRSKLTLTHSGGTVSSTIIYVRMKLGAADGVSGDIQCTSTGAATQNVSTGTGIVGYPNYFVDAGGNNSNDGQSSGSPFQTLTYAVSKIGCIPTVINVASGVYTDESIAIY